MSRRGGGRLFVFSDWDGTLYPFHPPGREPELSPSRRRILTRLADSPRTTLVIVSGRPMHDLERLVRVPKAVLASEHGADPSHPRRPDPSKRNRPAAWLERLRPRLPRGVNPEPKRFCLAIHLSRVAPLDRWAVGTALRDFARGRRLRVLPGHLVLELSPRSAHKGRFVASFLRRVRFDRARDRAIFLGDHESDEEAFRTLDGRCETVRIRPDGPTAAARSLPNLAAAWRFLERLAP